MLESDPRASSHLVWFFGPSCAGKATLIREVAAHPAHPLRSHLGIQSSVEISAASLEPSDRSDLGPLIRGQLRPGLWLLIKGQSRDISVSEHCLPAQLAAELPATRHSVVFVWADPTELDRRALRRAEERASERAYWLWHYGRSAAELTWQAYWTERLGLDRTWVRAEAGRISIGEEPPPCAKPEEGRHVT